MAKRPQGTTASQTGLRESFGNTKKARWEQADPELLRECIASVAKPGGALRLGYSRDGGAYAIGVYGDGDPYTLYVPPSEDVDEVLTRISNAFAELS